MAQSREAQWMDKRMGTSCRHSCLPACGPRLFVRVLYGRLHARPAEHFEEIQIYMAVVCGCTLTLGFEPQPKPDRTQGWHLAHKGIPDEEGFRLTSIEIVGIINDILVSQPCFLLYILMLMLTLTS